MTAHLKQKPKFDSPRPQRMRVEFNAAMQDLRQSFFVVGRGANTGGWKRPATRARIKNLARQIARSAMRDEARKVGTLPPRRKR